VTNSRFFKPQPGSPVFGHVDDGNHLGGLATLPQVDAAAYGGYIGPMAYSDCPVHELRARKGSGSFFAVGESNEQSPKLR
jgi:hypothetical protein